MNREFLMLAHLYKGQDVSGWYASEKLDGMRAFWDGGITWGIPTTQIPWANTTQSEIATGLWSRYGHPIHAPKWWVSTLPSIPLDGELWIGPQKFQEVMRIVRRDIGDERWNQVKFKIFDAPSFDSVFMSGRINNPNFKHKIDRNLCLHFVKSHGYVTANRLGMYEHSLAIMADLPESEFLSVLPQVKLSGRNAESQVESMLIEVTNKRGEGLVLRNPRSIWEPKRTSTLLKVKKLYDAEGIIIGYTWGEGKLTGLMGAIVVNWRGKQFQLSGFTDTEREMSGQTDANPSSVVHPSVHNPKFPRGTMVTFGYHDLSEDGIPKNARFLRKAA